MKEKYFTRWISIDIARVHHSSPAFVARSYADMRNYGLIFVHATKCLEWLLRAYYPFAFPLFRLIAIACGDWLSAAYIRWPSLFPIWACNKSVLINNHGSLYFALSPPISLSFSDLPFFRFSALYFCFVRFWHISEARQKRWLLTKWNFIECWCRRSWTFIHGTITSRPVKKLVKLEIHSWYFDCSVIFPNVRLVYFDSFLLLLKLKRHV